MKKLSILTIIVLGVAVSVGAVYAGGGATNTQGSKDMNYERNTSNSDTQGNMDMYYDRDMTDQTAKSCATLSGEEKVYLGATSSQGVIGYYKVNPSDNTVKYLVKHPDLEKDSTDTQHGALYVNKDGYDQLIFDFSSEGMNMGQSDYAQRYECDLLEGRAFMALTLNGNEVKGSVVVIEDKGQDVENTEVDQSVQ